jgi:hypothetical protein
MLIVLANSADPVAPRLVDRWASHDARLMTPADLSIAGWRDYLGGTVHTGQDRSAVIGGTVVPVSLIRGVLTRLPAVLEQDLAAIVPEDRPYVAAEMTAFLRSWLSRLPCPVINHPTDFGLCGPTWRLERWVMTAAHIGIPVRSIRRSTDTPDYPHIHELVGSTVCIVGPRVIGEADPEVLHQAQTLARVVGAEVLAVRFSGPDAGSSFLSADTWPDPLQEEVSEALLNRLLADPQKPRSA